MPADLERDFALSALPHTCAMVPPFICWIRRRVIILHAKGRMDFAHLSPYRLGTLAEFIQDNYAAISYDEEGVKTYMPVYLDVAEMRASGKYSPTQIRDIILKRVKDGKYKAPSRTGVSYMLSPLLRTHPGTESTEIVNMVMPHYMFYAPRVDNTDIGGEWDAHSPYAINSGKILDKENSIFNYIILPAGDTEKARIIEENKDLLRRLAEYKPYLKVDTSADSHHH